MTTYQLYTPPQWRAVAMMTGSLRVSVPVSTCVYRRGGVWHNVQVAGEQDVTGIDVWTDPDDASVQLVLFFTGPVLVPDAIQSDLAAITPADPSWSPGGFAGPPAPPPVITPPSPGGPTETFHDNGDGTVSVTGAANNGDGTVTITTGTDNLDGTVTVVTT